MAPQHVEHEILKPLDPTRIGEEHENEWPVFQLRKAVVRDAAGEPVSLLVANAAKLLTITGELRCRKKDEKFLQEAFASTVRGRTIQLKVGPVGRYAFGEDNDGFSVWAAGKSGWFLLEPAQECQPIFDLMYNDIRAWYFVLDRVQSKKSQKDPLLSFATENGLTLDAAEETFQRASQFILNNMAQNKEGIKWDSQPIVKCIPGYGPPAPKAPSRGRPPKHRSRGSGATSNTELVKAEDLSGAPSPVRELDRQKQGAAILWKFIQQDPQKKSTLQELIPKLYSEYQFDSETQVRQYLFYQSPELLKHMQERRNRKEWGTTKLFRELVECTLSAKVAERMARITVRTRDYAFDAMKIEQVTSSDEEPPDGHQPVSSLRPRSGKGFARKSKSYRGRDASSAVDGDERATTPAKRKFDDTLDETDAAALRRLRVRSADAASSQRDSSAEPSGEPPATTATLALRWRGSGEGAGAGAALALDGVLEAGIVEANAPGDVWRCTAVGCVHAVYGASGKLGRRLIEEHVGEHRSDDDAPQVNLAVREMEKCKLPVSNLIKKIREFAAAQDHEDASVGAEDDGYPAAIRRLMSQ